MADVALVTTMLRDAKIASCAAAAGTTPQTYVAGAFDLRRLSLRTGEQMTVAIAKDSCLTLGQSTRIIIFERMSGGYRRVLDEVTLPGLAEVNADGNVMLPTHESMQVIFEAKYVWTGTAYALSELQSHRYDVALAQRKPYEVPVRFASGTFATTLAGSVAYNFGDDYLVEGRAGQRMTIELKRHTGRRPRVALYFNAAVSSLVDLNEAKRWDGQLPKTGAYHLLVSGTDERDESRLSTYAIFLAIR